MATTWKILAILGAAVAAATVGCSAADSGSDDRGVPDGPAVTLASDDTTAQPTPDPAGPASSDASGDGSTVGDVAVESMSDAVSATCAIERDTLEMAVDAYTAMTGAPPASVDELVGDLLRGAPAGWEIDGSGAIVAVAGGPCV